MNSNPAFNIYLGDLLYQKQLLVVSVSLSTKCGEYHQDHRALVRIIQMPRHSAGNDGVREVSPAWRIAHITTISRPGASFPPSTSIC